MSTQQQTSSDPTFAMTDAELAEYYEQGGTADFDGGELVPAETSRPSRGVVMSVRFSDDEIAQLRDRAEADGLKVTAWVRQAALDQVGPPLDRENLIDTLTQQMELTAIVAQKLRASVERRHSA